MADFSLTTLFVVPVGQTTLPSSGSISTQTLTAGQVGIFNSGYSAVNATSILTSPYFYVAQGRANTYLQGSKRSDRISGKNNAGTGSNVTEWYKVSGCATASNQVTDVTGFNVQCGDSVTLTLRATSSYLQTLYFNGLTRSVTVEAPCCNCSDNPCDTITPEIIIDLLIAKLNQAAPGINSDNISFSTFYTFTKVGVDTLRITGKPLTKYGQPCDVAANPFEYDRMTFRTFVYSGPATTADFIVADDCNVVATATITQRASYPTGQAEEIAQLEKNFYSYQAGYLKHLYRMAGYNQNFETYVSSGVTYNTFYIKFNEYDKSTYQWGDYIQSDSTVIIAAPNATTSGISILIENVLEAALGTVLDNNSCPQPQVVTSPVIP